MIVATCLWDANEHTAVNSGTYSEVWAERLYRSVRRHLTAPFRFVCFTDRPRQFAEPIEQEMLEDSTPGYGSFTEPYRLNDPMILVGLDTIFVGNIDHFAEWCKKASRIALPRDPKVRTQSINGVAFVPGGWRCVHDEWDGANDMVHMRRYPWVCIDDLWPGQVVSYKLRVRPDGEDLKAARIVYFHGQPKADSLSHIPWVREHWA